MDTIRKQRLIREALGDEPSAYCAALLSRSLVVAVFLAALVAAPSSKESRPQVASIDAHAAPVTSNAPPADPANGSN